MAIKFERDEKGNVIAIDTETGKTVGSVSTMGALIKIHEKQ